MFYRLGFIAVLMDSSNSVTIVHFESMKSKRIPRSALASELYAIVLGFGQCFVIQKAADLFLSRPNPLKIYTDSKPLFDSLTTLNTTAEKRLPVDLSVLRESYEKREITEILWIPRNQIPVDDLTKKAPCTALEEQMKNNKVPITPSAWIKREIPTWVTKSK